MSKVLLLFKNFSVGGLVPAGISSVVALSMIIWYLILELLRHCGHCGIVGYNRHVYKIRKTYEVMTIHR